MCIVVIGCNVVIFSVTVICVWAMWLDYIISRTAV